MLHVIKNWKILKQMQEKKEEQKQEPKVYSYADLLKFENP